jgi:hypothetical protein
MSDTKAVTVRRRINTGRVVVLSMLVSFGGFLLWAIVCDFPPFQSETLPERLSAIASAIISWPVILAISALPEAAAKILALPALILSGLFWAVLVELLIARYARNA